MSLLDCGAKICLTSAGVLIHKNQVLLVKHKKLQIWLNPGGHIEANETPHQAAQREFLEETGLKTKALFLGPQPDDDDTEYQPTPFLTNLHWVCEDNFVQRTKDPDHYQPAPQWQRGCEQHLNLVYLMQLVGEDTYQKNHAESDDIRWFTWEALEFEDIKPNIAGEIKMAFEIAKNLKN